MKILSKVAALAAMLLVLVLPTAAGAQTYPGPSSPDLPPTDTPTGGGDDGDVLGDDEEQGGGVVGGPSTADNDGVLGDGTVGAPATAEVSGGTAPSGSLPITGGDVVGLALIGGAAVGAGALLVRRSRSLHRSGAA